MRRAPAAGVVIGSVGDVDSSGEVIGISVDGVEGTVNGVVGIDTVDGVVGIMVGGTGTSLHCSGLIPYRSFIIKYHFEI